MAALGEILVWLRARLKLRPIVSETQWTHHIPFLKDPAIPQEHHGQDDMDEKKTFAEKVQWLKSEERWRQCLERLWNELDLIGIGMNWEKEIRKDTAHQALVKYVPG